MSTPNHDAISAVFRECVTDEVNDLLEVLRPSDLDAYEMAGLLSILRSAMERNYPHGADTAATVIELVQR